MLVNIMFYEKIFWCRVHNVFKEICMCAQIFTEFKFEIINFIPFIGN